MGQEKEAAAAAEPATLITLRPRPARAHDRKKVVWTEDTVDNEHMNKKKSKCCCIYEKPHKFGESDSEDSDEECEHCFGHVEKRKAAHTRTLGGATTATITIAADVVDSGPSEPTVVIALQPKEEAQSTNPQNKDETPEVTPESDPNQPGPSRSGQTS